MIKQAFGRACLSLVSAIVVAGGLTACGSGDSVRSPDLPGGDVSAARVSCPTDISVGDSAQCTLECDYRQIDKDGNVTTETGACPAGKWSTDCDGLTVSQSGVITGVSPASGCNVTFIVDGVKGTDGPIDVNAVTANCAVIYPAGSGDVIPDGTCTNDTSGTTDTAITNYDIEVPVGTRIPLRAAVRLSDGTLCYAPDAPSGQTTCAAGLVTFFTSDANVATFPDPTDGIVTAVDVGEANLTATATVNAVVMTVREFQLESTLCVEPLQPQLGCQSYNLASVVCEGASTIPNIPVGGDFQFRARAFFDVTDGDPDTGLVCDVTSNENTTWSIADVGTEASANPTVAQDGKVSGGDTATTEATVMASFDLDGDTNTTDDVADGTHDFNVVDGLVLASNSLIASATTLDQTDPVPTRAACIGSSDLVSGLIAPGGVLAAEKGFYAVTRKCAASDVSGTACTEGSFDNTSLDDVTNAESGNGQANEADGAITWSVEPGYWDGSNCTLAQDPAGQGDALVNVVWGDNDAGDRYTDGAAFTGQADSRIYAGGTDEDNGVVESAGPVRINTNCLKATYNATNTDGNAVASSDGITLIILPLTSDSLLTDPDADGAVALCNTLVPLFSLGGSAGGVDGVVTQLVATVAAILNPVTTAAGDGGLDDAVTQILGALDDGLEDANEAGLNALTGPLTDVLEQANAGVLGPLTCAVGTILDALVTQDPSSLPEIQGCADGGGTGGDGDGDGGSPLDMILDPILGLQEQNPLPFP